MPDGDKISDRSARITASLGELISETVIQVSSAGDVTASMVMEACKISPRKISTKFVSVPSSDGH